MVRQPGVEAVTYLYLLSLCIFSEAKDDSPLSDPVSKALNETMFLGNSMSSGTLSLPLAWFTDINILFKNKYRNIIGNSASRSSHSNQYC